MLRCIYDDVDDGGAEGGRRAMHNLSRAQFGASDMFHSFSICTAETRKWFHLEPG